MFWIGFVVGIVFSWAVIGIAVAIASSRYNEMLDWKEENKKL